MTVAEMFGQSAVLTLLGMGVVFGFLVIMIITISAAGKIIHTLGWDKDLQKQPVKAQGLAAAPVGGVQNAAITAAISAAVTEYRKTH
jgi:oxaloacetate decarboxylase gamma subunit